MEASTTTYKKGSLTVFYKLLDVMFTLGLWVEV